MSEIHLLHRPPHRPRHRAARQDDRHSKVRSSCILCKAERIKGTPTVARDTITCCCQKKYYGTTNHLSFLNKSSAWSKAARWRRVLTFAQLQADLTRKLGRASAKRSPGWQPPLRAPWVSLPPLALRDTETPAPPEPLLIHMRQQFGRALALSRIERACRWPSEVPGRESIARQLCGEGAAAAQQAQHTERPCYAYGTPQSGIISQTWDHGRCCSMLHDALRTTVLLWHGQVIATGPC